MTVSLNAAFDGGNIRPVAIDGDRIDCEIVQDAQSDFFQWFFFRAAGVSGRTLTFRLLNAGASAYPFGWPDYKVRASTDLQAWRMIDTAYEDGVLSFTWQGDTDLVWFAYFAPYTMAMHDALIARIALQPGVSHRELGRSLDGQALDLLTIGTGPKPVWLYGR